MLEFEDQAQGPRIKVVGVGGGGGNAVNTMIEAGIQGVDFVAANTDCQVLETNQATIKIQLGKNLTKGLGAGANPDIGCAAALEDASRLAEVLSGADMVFVTAGMGGGTGTGAAPVIARVAREMGALTVGVVTKPFMFEGLQRKKKANSGIAELAKSVDALIVIPNDRLVALAGNKMTLRESFAMVDNVCSTAVRGISDLIMVPGLINVDFADVRTIMTGMGRALMGSGHGRGDKRALDAAQMAINSPLLEDVSINGATGILVNITGGPDLTLAEVTTACSLIQEAADPDANIIFGSVVDANLTDEVRITVIATGFQSRTAVEASTSSAARPGGKKAGENQMSLPMRPTPASAQLATAPAAHPAPAAAQPAPAVTPQRSSVATAPQWGSAAPVAVAPVPGTAPQWKAAAPVTAPPPASPVPACVEFADTASEDFASSAIYPTIAVTYTPPPVVSAAASVSDRTPTGSESRPLIRSSASMASASAGSRRTPGPMPAALPDHLGIEENEFDKPTYLRRALAAESGLRMPGEGNKL
jgi:cell division protein FtsZ